MILLKYYLKNKRNRSQQIQFILWIFIFKDAIKIFYYLIIIENYYLLINKIILLELY